ncbi:MAG: hypothetical protein Q9224_002469 [Gallowayella concinna]
MILWPCPIFGLAIINLKTHIVGYPRSCAPPQLSASGVRILYATSSGTAEEVCPDYLRFWILFGHLNGPDAGPGAYIEDASGIVEGSKVEVATSEEESDMVLNVDSFELLLSAANVSQGEFSQED